jgi:hypothetical protein
MSRIVIVILIYHRHKPTCLNKVSVYTRHMNPFFKPISAGNFENVFALNVK